MRKKLMAGGLAALGCAVLGMGAAGTYAGFVDTEQAPQTQLQAGTLDLRLTTEEGAESDPITLAGLVPAPTPPLGSNQPSEHSYVVRLSNDGSVPGTALWGTSGVAELENGCNEAEEAAGDTSCGEQQGELGDQLRVSLSLLPGAGCEGTPAIVSPEQYPATDERAFKPIRPGGTGDPIVLAPGENRCARVDVYFPHLPHNNVAQGDSSSFRLAFRLDQTS
jgi:predicted ribosomally synthesized peptide with SipW-like signal peptide